MNEMGAAVDRWAYMVKAMLDPDEGQQLSDFIGRAGFDGLSDPDDPAIVAILAKVHANEQAAMYFAKMLKLVR